MRTHSRRQAPVPHLPEILCGIAHRELNSITCQIDVRGDWSYELYVVPHWDPSAALIERFAAPTPALLRQAEVAQQLRANGCTVIEHGAALGFRDAA